MADRPTTPAPAAPAVAAYRTPTPQKPAATPAATSAPASAARKPLRGPSDLPPASRVAMEAAPRPVEKDESSALKTYADLALRDYPLATLAAAAGIGAVAGWLIKR